MKKIFDNVFRTLCEKNPKLLIPIINALFSTDYALTDKLDLLSGEHHLLPNADLDETEEIVTDSCIRLGNKLYHIECQSTPDGSMVLRMVEYDFYIALEHAEKVNGVYEMEFPQSAVLYLRHTSETPDNMEMRVKFPNGESVTYSVPIVKVQQFNADDLLKKKLFFIIPYYILRYENKSNDVNIEELKQEYQKLYDGMKEAFDEGFLEEYDMTNIVQFTNDLVEYVFKDNQEVKKGVTDIMGGTVLETYADKVGNKRYSEGQEKMAKLTDLLLNADRLDDLKRCTKDTNFRDSLFIEFGLN